MLQDAGIEGQTVVQFVISSDGRVDPATVRVIQTSHEQFAQATINAVERFRFKPGRYQGKPVPVLIQLPVTWKVER
jgi:protein TonB